MSLECSIKEMLCLVLCGPEAILQITDYHPPLGGNTLKCSKELLCLVLCTNLGVCPEPAMAKIGLPFRLGNALFRKNIYITVVAMKGQVSEKCLNLCLVFLDRTTTILVQGTSV